MRRALRDASIEVLKNLPASSSLEEIMYEINLTAQVIEGLGDVEEGRLLEGDELLKRISEWKKK
jgi:predicted transcriptional regulator